VGTGLNRGFENPKEKEKEIWKERDTKLDLDHQKPK
jgi:hypothetical protein